jgi:hypothetical protein
MRLPWTAPDRARRDKKKTPPEGGVISLRVGGKVLAASGNPSFEDRQDSSHPPERRISTVSNTGLPNMRAVGCVFSVARANARIAGCCRSDPARESRGDQNRQSGSPGMRTGMSRLRRHHTMGALCLRARLGIESGDEKKAATSAAFKSMIGGSQWGDYGGEVLTAR